MEAAWSLCMHQGPLRWLCFATLLGGLLALDLFVHRRGRATSPKAAALWAALWVLLGTGFAGVVAASGTSDWEEYLAAYAMEKCLSLDNMFIFLLIFRSLHIPRENQHTALVWGILAALVLRGLFILVGVSALEHWEWVRLVFAGLLVLAAIHAMREELGKEEQSPVVAWLAARLPVASSPHSRHFFAREGGRRVATPLLVALIAIEVSDVVFAVDSVPAALSITRDRFIVYSSNAFAVLGLRSLFIAAERLLTRLRYLHYGLAAVLGFAAAKLALGDWVRVPALLSVSIIVTLIASAAGASLLADKRPRDGPAQAE